MGKRTRFREVVEAAVIMLAAAVVLAVVSHSVGGREQISTEVATATASAPSSSALVPAPSEGDNGEDGSEWTATWIAGPPTAASTVTQSALTGEGGAGITRDIYPPTMPSRPTVTASPADGGALTPSARTVIDPVPATPSAQAAPVGSYAPWPVELWPMVECLIWRESRGDPSAVGAQGEIGLMQVGPANFTYLAERGISPASLYDGPTNIRAGWLLYLYWQDATGDGFRPWRSTRGGC